MDFPPKRIPDSVNRRLFIGGSDAGIIMGSDAGALLRLWQEKRGEVEPADLSGDLIVQLGTATEHLNRAWYERQTGHAIEQIQRRVFHPVHKWMSAPMRFSFGSRLIEKVEVWTHILFRRWNQPHPSQSLKSPPQWIPGTPFDSP